MSEVSLLLKMLDQENLSSSAQEKKTSVWNLLQQIQPSGEDACIKDEGTKNAENSNFWCMLWDGNHYFFIRTLLLSHLQFQEQITST